MNKKHLSIVVALCVVWFALPAFSAPTPVRTYVWYGELAGINEDAKMALVTARFREHVLRYIDEFKPGDRVVLTWAPKDEVETDDIIYVGAYKQSSGRNFGCAAGGADRHRQDGPTHQLQGTDPDNGASIVERNADRGSSQAHRAVRPANGPRDNRGGGVN